MFRRHRPPRPPAETTASIGPSPVVEIDDASFMAETARRVTIVDFWAPWCGPCRAFAPVFEAAAVAHDGRATLGRCNVDANPRTTALLDIQSIPTLVVFGPDGSELERVVGLVLRRQLDALIERVSRPASHDPELARSKESAG